KLYGLSEAERMTYSFKNIPQFTVGIEVNVKNLIKAKEELIPNVKKLTGYRLSLTAMLIKLVSMALLEFPWRERDYGDNCNKRKSNS
ncbi:2-oxo acid dehydrogenase subunit E2, partial [Candidatus Pacearchaeota archaeon]|nr:2-oxo acid dehydrogenase subunit E2 [Candidatus Pacearchaeota archaeon]